MVYNMIAAKSLFDRIEANELRAVIVDFAYDFQCMDELVISEGTGKPMKATAKKIRCNIDHVMSQTPGMQPGYRMLSISKIYDDE